MSPYDVVAGFGLTRRIIITEYLMVPTRQSRHFIVPLRMEPDHVKPRGSNAC